MQPNKPKKRLPLIILDFFIWVFILLTLSLILFIFSMGIGTILSSLKLI